MDSSFDQFEEEQPHPQIKLKSKSSNFFSCLLDCLSSCCLAVNCCLAGGFGCGDDDDDENDPNHSNKRKKGKSCLKNKNTPAGGNSRPNLYRGSSVDGVFNSSTDEFNLDELEFSSEELRNPSRSTTRTPLGGNSRTELYVICSRCSRYSQVSGNSKSCTKNHEDDNEQEEVDDDDEDEDEVFRLEKPRSLSMPGYSPGYSGISQTSSKGSKATKKSTGDEPNGEICVSRLAIISPTGFSDGFHSKPTSPTSQTSGDSLHRSPSNYCRVATCEQLHIHDLTPKCLETFAPSSTCSSCQTCDRPHIGPNHDQVLLVSKLLKHLQLPPSAAATPTSLTIPELKPTGPNMKHQNTSSYLMQWPLPEYRPQRSPDHLYRSFGF